MQHDPGRGGSFANRELVVDLLEAAVMAAEQGVKASEAGVDQVALAMQNIQQTSTQNMASTRQVERAAWGLNTLAQRLTALAQTSEAIRGHPVAERVKGGDTP